MSSASEANAMDLGRELLLDSEVLRREMHSLRKFAESATTAEASTILLPGISVVVATANGISRLPGMIESLVRQSLDPAHFEVVVITNGEPDGSQSLLEQTAHSHPQLNLRWFHRDDPGAGGARNLGVRLAAREYLTFLDDDDQLEPDHLRAVFALAREDAVVLTPIISVEDGHVVEDDVLAGRIRALPASASLTSAPWVLGFNACKTIPSRIAKGIRYLEHLRSGEDVAYFARLLEFPGLTLVKVDSPRTAYVRALRPNSVSRRTESYDFNVLERLEVISALEAIEAPEGAQTALTALKSAQRGFIERFMRNNEQLADRLESDVVAHGLPHFDWSRINDGRARDLAIAYCFTPYSDTSAIVAAKAIAERKRIVDVISNSMEGVRRPDRAVGALAARWVAKHREIDSPPSFAGWDQISDFAVKAVREAELLAASSHEYKTLYTRALWVGSHVAGALYKLRHWPTVWTAEFSDPLRFNSSGGVREGALKENPVSERLRRALTAKGFGDLTIRSLFDLVEAVTFVLADELVFTNHNQLEYMLESYPPVLRELVRHKATVRAHPTPVPSAYGAVPASVSLPERVVNLGYFGSFYANRGLDVVLTAIVNLPMSVRRRLRLHIYCSDPVSARNEVAAAGASANVYVRPYLPYMEFLSALKAFDVLVVNDVARGAGMTVNPFLPSKYSDYVGSGTDIWSIVDDGSPLSSLPARYMSPVDDAARARDQLIAMIGDHLGPSPYASTSTE